MVYYRKYRPQKISELDSTSVRETLSAVLSKDPSHAFLFTGPKGLGKTSTARIVAKVINCTAKRKDIEPCNKCEQCISITNGTNVDVLEIDAASNRGIDEIRDLKEKIRLSPMESSRKVYIIDEVHMLTTEAFNALLKTLEEPPAHAMFILCTTEPQKVPATIISRCLHVNFSLATTTELIRSFKRVVKAEKIAIDDKALLMIANLSEGGFRDGIKILEEIASFSKGKITEKFIEEKYNVSSIKHYVLGLINSLVEKDSKQGLQIVKVAVEKGIDIKHFMQQLMEQLHERLLIQVKLEKPNVSDDSEFSIEEIKVLFDLFSKAYADMKYAVIQQLPLELAIIEYSQIHADKNAELGGKEHQRLSATPASASISDMRKQVGNIKKIKAMYGSPATNQSSADDEQKTEHVAVELMHAPASGPISAEWLENLWKNIISEMKTYNHTVAGVLRGCRIESYDKKKLIIQTSYKFHKERLDDNKTKDELARICKMLTGKDIAVVVELKK